MNKKLKKNGGFTLVEMLIVVAIIAILIAISIPLVSSALEKSRHAVDDANRRDAISLATVYYLTHHDEITDWTAEEVTYAVKNSQGVLIGGTATDDKKASDPVTGAEAVTKECTCNERTYEDNNLKVTYDVNGNVTTTWDSACTTSKTPASSSN